MAKVAIVKDGFDMGRIITGSSDDGSYDFKINFLDNEYEITTVKLFEKPSRHRFDNSNQWEITYHRSLKGKPPIIHLKHKSKEQPNRYPPVNRIYDTLDLKRLLEPTIIADFPIPLMKVVVPKHIGAKVYKGNPKDHVLLDMEDANVAEIYLTHTDFDFDVFEEKWPTLHFNLMTNAIEFFATNDIKHTADKLQYFLPDDGVRTAAISFNMADDIKLFINIYNDNTKESLNNAIEVTFIENEMYYALLGLTTVRYPERDGSMSKPMNSFEMDLKRDSHHFGYSEKEKWRYRFNKWQELLDREIKKHRSRL